jgi:hypothetical protein
LNFLNSIPFQKRFDGSSQLALLQEKRRFRQAKRNEVDSGTRGDSGKGESKGLESFRKGMRIGFTRNAMGANFKIITL